MSAPTPLKKETKSMVFVILEWSCGVLLSCRDRTKKMSGKEEKNTEIGGHRAKRRRAGKNLNEAGMMLVIWN